ncbi:TonB-dependent receptor [Rugamonas sp. FT82W]|uniref:TonB-dependent receptor n=2 Tax=Duganella vulcania TaxID=2692166 RepID=A0A845FWI2_9BURK|nr:TonB-dependent receptor [Duganella vulcania]
MSHQSAKKKLMSLAIGSACAVMAGAAGAQQQEGDASAIATKDQVAEVKVTATRHSTSLLKTPVAVTAVTQEALSRDGITDVRGLSGQIPNLQLGTSNDGSGGVQIAIRGVSSSDFTEIGNPAVGLHVAGLYQPRPQAALALMFDLDQVEVLRGPQGTLFGRNSTGGSINIIPAKPEFGSSYGTVEADVGTYRGRQISAVQNIPVSDNFALRVTAMKIKRDGYINQQQDFYAANFPALGIVPSRDAAGNIIPDVDQRFNRKVGADKYYTNKDEYAARLQARWKIRPDLDWRLTYEKYQNNGAGDLPIKDCEQAAGTPYACTGGQWDVKVNVPGVMDMTIDTVRSGLVWDLNPTTTIEYNASWSSQKRREIQDSDSGYQPIESELATRPGTSPFNDYATYTTASKYVSTVHELQLRGKYDRLRYVAGLFWMHEKNSIDYAQDYLGASWGTYGFPAESYFYHQADRQSDSKAIFAQADWEFAPTWNLTVGGRMTRDTRKDVGGQYWDTAFSDDPAIYFKGLHNPGTPGTPGFVPFNSSDLKPGMGGYYGAGGFDSSIHPVISDDSDAWKKFTWRLGLSRQLTPRDLVYTSLSTGYKAGGFSDKEDICRTGLNGNCAGMTPGPHYTNMPWNPETLTNFELGYKGRLLNNKLTFSATAFYSRYKDMQLTGGVTVGKIIPKIPCTATNPYCDSVVIYGTQNAAQANISGLEIEGEYKPWPGSHIGYSYSHLKAVIKSYPTYSEDSSISCNIRDKYGAPPCVAYEGTDPLFAGKFPLNIAGNRLPYAPANTLNLSASQDFAIGEYTLTPWISARWQDKMYFSLRNLDNPHISDAQKAYTTVDAAVKLVSPSGKWHLEAYVKNWGQTLAKNYASVVDPGYVTASYNDPRVYGIRFGATW